MTVTMLPNMNGYEICRNIRGEIDVPIIMVTAKGEDPDKVRGLGCGVSFQSLGLRLYSAFNLSVAIS